MIALLLMLVALLPVPTSTPACHVGQVLRLRSHDGWPHVFVWDSMYRLSIWKDDEWEGTDVLGHEVNAAEGTRVLVIASSSSGCAPVNSAYAVRILDGFYKNHYGYVDSEDTE